MENNTVTTGNIAFDNIIAGLRGTFDKDSNNVVSTLVVKDITGQKCPDGGLAVELSNTIEFKPGHTLTEENMKSFEPIKHRKVVLATIANDPNNFVVECQTTEDGKTVGEIDHVAYPGRNTVGFLTQFFIFGDTPKYKKAEPEVNQQYSLDVFHKNPHMANISSDIVKTLADMKADIPDLDIVVNADVKGDAKAFDPEHIDSYAEHITFSVTIREDARKLTEDELTDIEAIRHRQVLVHQVRDGHYQVSFNDNNQGAEEHKPNTYAVTDALGIATSDVVQFMLSGDKNEWPRERPSPEVIAQRMREYHAKMVQKIKEGEFMIQAVFDPEGVKPTFGYTVGLSIIHGWPEILVIGNLDQGSLGGIVHSVVDRWKKDGRASVGEMKLDDGNGGSFKLHCNLVAGEEVKDQYTCKVEVLKGDRAYSVMQVLWQDPNGNMPDSPEYNPEKKKNLIQPVLPHLE